MPDLTVTFSNVPQDMIDDLRLAVAEKLRGPSTPGQSWSPPNPATLAECKTYMAMFAKATVLEYRQLVDLKTAQPISVPDFGS